MQASDYNGALPLLQQVVQRLHGSCSPARRRKEVLQLAPDLACG